MQCYGVRFPVGRNEQIEVIAWHQVGACRNLKILHHGPLVLDGLENSASIKLIPGSVLAVGIASVFFGTLLVPQLCSVDQPDDIDCFYPSSRLSNFWSWASKVT